MQKFQTLTDKEILGLIEEFKANLILNEGIFDQQIFKINQFSGKSGQEPADILLKKF
jgi:hypothetical protein